MQRIGRERLDAFIPRLLAQAVEHDNPDLVLERVLPWSRLWQGVLPTWYC